MVSQFPVVCVLLWIHVSQDHLEQCIYQYPLELINIFPLYRSTSPPLPPTSSPCPNQSPHVLINTHHCICESSLIVLVDTPTLLNNTLLHKPTLTPCIYRHLSLCPPRPFVHQPTSPCTDWHPHIYQHTFLALINIPPCSNQHSLSYLDLHLRLCSYYGWSIVGWSWAWILDSILGSDLALCLNCGSREQICSIYGVHRVCISSRGARVKCWFVQEGVGQYTGVLTRKRGGYW